MRFVIATCSCDIQTGDSSIRKIEKLTAVLPIQLMVLKVVAVCQYLLCRAENRTIKRKLASTLRNNPIALRTSYLKTRQRDVMNDGLLEDVPRR